MRYCTLTEIHNLSMMDTEYIALAAQGYDPNLEHQLKIPTHLLDADSQRSGGSLEYK